MITFLDRLFVILHVAAADAGDLDLDQGRFIVDLRHVEFAIHGLIGAHFHGRRDFLNHVVSFR